MPLIVVAAHPDDEILGMGLFLAAQRNPCILVHVTDGAPRSGDDIRHAGCATWQEYAALRRHELQGALAVARVTPVALASLECPDQQASWRIADHAPRIASLIGANRSATVVTHAYEGGHPDHDATAAAVHAAWRLLNHRAGLFEFAGYHASAKGFTCERFLRDSTSHRPLTEDQRQWKRRVLNCFVSQSETLAQFPLNCEPIREAPDYAFDRPPHEGPLYYERFNWGVNGKAWRTLAVRAFRDLGISCVC